LSCSECFILQYRLLIGKDFLNTVEVNLKQDLISITSICKQIINDEIRLEIFVIDIQGISTIDIFDVRDDEHRHIITNLIEHYQPNRMQEIYVKMTIILKDDQYINTSKDKMIITERGT